MRYMDIVWRGLHSMDQLRSNYLHVCYARLVDIICCDKLIDGQRVPGNKTVEFVRVKQEDENFTSACASRENPTVGNVIVQLSLMNWCRFLTGGIWFVTKWLCRWAIFHVNASRKSWEMGVFSPRFSTDVSLSTLRKSRHTHGKLLAPFTNQYVKNDVSEPQGNERWNRRWNIFRFPTPISITMQYQCACINVPMYTA